MIEPLREFWPAESLHYHYYMRKHRKSPDKRLAYQEKWDSNCALYHDDQTLIRGSTFLKKSMQTSPPIVFRAKLANYNFLLSWIWYISSHWPKASCIRSKVEWILILWEQYTSMSAFTPATLSRFRLAKCIQGQRVRKAQDGLIFDRREKKTKWRSWSKHVS